MSGRLVFLSLRFQLIERDLPVGDDIGARLVTALGRKPRLLSQRDACGSPRNAA